jgi:hypothetical protein
MRRSGEVYVRLLENTVAVGSQGEELSMNALNPPGQRLHY